MNNLEDPQDSEKLESASQSAVAGVICRNNPRGSNPLLSRLTKPIALDPISLEAYLK